LFVVIKLEFPSNFLQNIAPIISRNGVVQAEEHHDQENEDIMEEYDGTNQMIQDLFSQPNEDGENVDIYDEPLLEKANKRLYEGSREIFSLLHCC
jgi:hypothetical protein